ncbi:MAG: HEAT repeat domain-containing protein, partial [Muribaculaceae bacterium]|nr:HEAT repeat domain-containing protein [Muribaculaceae bacterium]
MKRNFFLLLGAAVALSANAKAPVVEQALNPNLPTAFAIVVDEDTYNATLPSISRYREAVERDGLSTYVLHANWENPDEVRNAIIKLGDDVPSLEGFVLVGDVPVAMLRNAQHNTTAFKMDEDGFPMLDSSVPSDRFYDVPSMQYRFLKQDAEHPHLFYYELEETSPQWVKPKWYSARIRYPKAHGGDAHQAIAKFLDKAAKAKDDMKNDTMDHLVVFNGHGYNSDCLIAWMDEEKAYRENFPKAFDKATGYKHWNFRMDPKMKYKIFEELKRPETDIFMFHEHGGPTTQYINGSEPGSSIDSRMLDLRRGVYSYLKRGIRKGADKDTLMAELSKEYGLTPGFFNDFDNPEFWKADSIDRADINLYSADLHGRITNPKMVMFDACYNGSFHEDDYIAGDYLFNDGNTLVTQGNTRNVLQDRWTLEMVGLMSHGMRAGHYNRMVASLEGHMQGDPTVRFSPVVANTIAQNITLKKDDDAYWRSLLDYPYADVQMLAMRMLTDNDKTGAFSPELLEIYKTSPFNTVRMEAIKMLSRYNNADFLEAVKLGVNDPYELVARLSADYAGEIGDKSLLPAMVEAYLDGNERQRVGRTLLNSL